MFACSDQGETFGTAADPGQPDPFIVSYLQLPKKGLLNQKKCGVANQAKMNILFLDEHNIISRTNLFVWLTDIVCGIISSFVYILAKTN